MSIPPSKEPRPLTPKDWKDAVERAWKARKAEREKQEMIEWRKHHAERVAENARGEKERNRDKRFTEEQENMLKQLHERRTKDSHLMIVEVRDNRHEITLDDIEMIEKMIEIEEGETKEVVTGVKQTLVEPDAVDAVKMEIEDPPLLIEEPVKMIEEKEVDVMEPQEKEVIEEKKQEKMEYGYTADVLIKDIFTSDNESKWDRTSVKTEQIRFVFEPIKTEMGFSAPRELRITIHNNPRLKKKKEGDEWVVDRVFQDVNHEIVKVVGKERTTLQWDDKWFIEQAREKEIATEVYDANRITGSEQRLWTVNNFKRDGATTNVSSIVDISSAVFRVELTDLDEYIERRNALQETVKRSAHLSDLAIETTYKYRSIEQYSEVLKARMAESSALLLPIIGKLLGITDPETLSALSMTNYTKEYLEPLFNALPEEYRKAALNKLNEYYDSSDDYKAINQEDFPQWIDKGQELLFTSESNLENLDRTLQGRKQRTFISKFRVEVKSDPEMEVVEAKKEIPRYLHITFQFESVEQQQEIEELFKYSLQYVVIRIDEHTQRDQEYLQKKVEDDKRSYEEWKAKQETKEE